MPPIKGSQLVLLTIAVSAGIFMNVLDTSIANVAIPTIAGNLGVSADQGTWVITSFTVSTAIVLPLTGWLAKRFGEVRLFIISTLLFTLTSFLCGFSSNFAMLVAFRALQGAVAGPMIPLSQSLLLKSFPSDKKGFATSLWAMVAVAGPVLGPILGGYITDNYHWPWIFYINIPVGIFAAYFTWKILGKRDTEITKTPIDFIGLVLLAIGVGCLQVLLDRGQDLDWFNSNVIIILAICSFVALSFFLVWELTSTSPIVDLSLFKSRNFTVGTLALSFGFIIYFGCVVIMPLWLQTQQNYTPTWAGFAIAPLGILPLILSPVVGRLINKVDLRLFVSFGFLVFAFTCFWQTSFNTDVDFNHLVLIRFIQGLGAPCFFIPTTAILLSGLPDNRLASAAGLSTFLRILGGSFGTSISVALWDRREALHQSRLVESLASYNPTLIESLRQLNGLGFMDLQRYGKIYQSLISQSYMLSTNDIFWGAGIIFLALLALIWFAKPPFLTKTVRMAE